MATDNQLPIADWDQLPEDLRDDLAAARDYAADQYATATRQAYDIDWRQFQEYARANGSPWLPAPPAMVASWLASLARAQDPGYSAATISRKLAAVNTKHVLYGYGPPGKDPDVKATMSGIRRNLGMAPNAKDPLLPHHLQAINALCSTDTLKGMRDRALILLGFGGAFRRSELANLTVEDLQVLEKGLLVRLERSKTDQEGRGRIVEVARGEGICPVRALHAWLEASAIRSGPVFRAFGRWDKIKDRALTGQSITTIVQDHAERVGFEPSRIGAHSLRAGFVTAALLAGESMGQIQDVTGHKSVATLMLYYRNAGAFENHPARKLL